MSQSTTTSVGHTPGPWRITDEMDRFHGGEFIRYGGIHDHNTGPLAVICDFNRYDRDNERKANAALIASAPDLLAALRELCDEFELSAAIDDETTTPYRALIAKAEGR